jgi:hypothetical protein
MFCLGRRQEEENNDAQVYVETHPVISGRQKVEDGD